MLISEKKVLEDMINDYDNKDMIKSLALVWSDLSNKQSDMGLKEKSNSSIMVSDLLWKIYNSLDDLT